MPPALGLDTHKLKRLWLHQANINMNEMIGRRVLGRDPTREENVIILDEYANTSSAGSIIAFHKHSDDMARTTRADLQLRGGLLRRHGLRPQALSIRARAALSMRLEGARGRTARAPFPACRVPQGGDA